MQSSVTAVGLCDQAGGFLDPVKNECVCPAGFNWSGTQCLTPDGKSAPIKDSADKQLQLVDQQPIGSDTQASLREQQNNNSLKVASAQVVNDESTTIALEAAKDSADLSNPSSPKPVPVAINPVGNTDDLPDEETTNEPSSFETGRIRTTVQKNCSAAGGEWLAKDGFCLCPKGRVLVGEICLEMTGELTRSVCERAASPGVWRDRQCRCRQVGFVFSPNRGGCVAMRLLSRATERRICESSLNRGKWQESHGSCICPRGKIWLAESCLSQADLSSEKVCESDVNHGRWDPEGKYCECPRGKLWINQSCRSLSNISMEQACTADINRGRWQEASETCRCPASRRWDAVAKRCRDH